MIRDELRAHDPALLEKPILTVFNKLDMPAAVDRLAGFPRGAARRPATTSSRSRPSTGRASTSCGRASPSSCPTATSIGAPPEPAGIVVHRIEAMGDGFSVEVEEAGVFRVRGRRIERIAAQTNFDVEESSERFQRDLARLGIDTELRRQGITPGDLVRIGAVELEWEAQPWEGE